MASHHHGREGEAGRGSVMATVVFLVFITISLVHQSCNINAAVAGGGVEDEEDDGKVVVSVYYESLCPYCANLIVNGLVKVFQTDLISVVKLRMIPWGNTQISPNNTWICQHGPDECLLNMVEACAIHVWPDPATHYRFIYCVESLHLENRHSEWQSCFSREELSSAPIQDCFRSQLEVRLELEHADETAGLNPPHRFVPWVLVNNQPLQQDYHNFVGYICRAYTGQRILKACQSPPSFDINSDDSSALSVCWYEA